MASMCRSCNENFENDGLQREHYRSEWHRYNLKRKVAGLPGVTAAWFEIRRKTLEAQSAVEERQLYACVLCDKEYSSAKAHANHLHSRAHQGRAAAVQDKGPTDAPVLRPRLASGRGALSSGDMGGQSDSKDIVDLKDMNPSNVGKLDEDADEDDDEWEEMDEDEAAAIAVEDGDVLPSPEAEAGELEEWDTACCLFCDWKVRQGDEVAECVEHMHRQHGFFVPDSEYLSKPRELLQYLGLKVSKGFMCLVCDERGRQFESLEAVRKHMVDKNHCKLRWGDGSGVAEEELEEFYDYSSSYESSEGMDLAIAGETSEALVLMSPGGMELVVKDGEGSKILGSRELARYYKQSPRPSDTRDAGLRNALVSRYKSMGLATRPCQWTGKQNRLKDNGVKASQRAEAFRTRVAYRENVNRDLPRHVLY